MFIDSLKNGKKSLNKQAYNSNEFIEIKGVQKDQLQNVLLEIFDYINALCEKNNIEFCLVGGSALGAVRHKRFIPWDDDLDLGMTRDCYNQFKTAFLKDNDKRYKLNAPNLSDKVRSRFPKILKNATVMRELTDSKDEETQGVFVDIFIIDNVPDNKLQRFFKGFFCNACEFIAGQVQLAENCDEQTRALLKKAGTADYITRITVGTLFSVIPSHKWLNLIDRIIQHNDNQSRFCSLATGRKHYFGEMMERDVFFPYSKAEFCSREVNVPSKWDAYLKNAYGDYMKIPPESHREHHYVKELKLK